MGNDVHTNTAEFFIYIRIFVTQAVLLFTMLSAVKLYNELGFGTVKIDDVFADYLPTVDGDG